MTDYKLMYTKLFNAISDAINILQAAQVQTEEEFISQKDTVISPIVPTEDKPE